MSLAKLVGHAVDKEHFQSVQDYIVFCERYLDFVQTGLQAQIVSQNEIHYQFYQYKEDGHFNITRPINTFLMYDAESFAEGVLQLLQILAQLRDRQRPDRATRQAVIRTIYTVQQAIGAALDALPAGKSNQARKVNGDLFERLIRLLIVSINIDCVAGVAQVPVKDEDGSPANVDDYERSALWKHLRHECQGQALWAGEFGGYGLRVLAVKAGE